MKFSLFIICIVLSTCTNAQKEKESTMKVIYVCQYHIFRPKLEYKIDLKNKLFWEYNVLNGKQRNKDAKNEGFSFVKKLTDDKIETFLYDVDKNEFDSWRTEYIDPNMDGGHQWRITITFDNGTIKNIQGSNQYPLTWNEMSLALKYLTGKDIIKIKK